MALRSEYLLLAGAQAQYVVGLVEEGGSLTGYCKPTDEVHGALAAFFSTRQHNTTQPGGFNPAALATR